MGFQCGIVGLPNAGKSTLFNALTASSAQAGNYPFCTIEPNVGVAAVPDPRLRRIAAIVAPQQVVPAVIRFVDIAGLVEGASRGEGLGNRFLAHIREMDAVAHVVRAFDDDNVQHVAGRVDPVADAGIINTELMLADLAAVERAMHKSEKASKGGDPQQRAAAALLHTVYEALNEGTPVRALAPETRADERLRQLGLLTAKPVLYVVNLGEEDPAGNPNVARMAGVAHAEGAEMVVVSAAIESELAFMEAAEQKMFLEEMGLGEPGLARFIRAGYGLLRLHTFFTAGEKEARAWTIPEGATAAQAAGAIHSDFERGFIRAETVACDDFIAHNGTHGAREAGRLRLEGRDYVVQDGDVMHFRFNV